MPSRAASSERSPREPGSLAVEWQTDSAGYVHLAPTYREIRIFCTLRLTHYRKESFYQTKKLSE